MRTKYNNRKTKIDGITFDSIREANRYSELKLLERAKKIKKLVLQPEFILQCGFKDGMGDKHRPITYRADFQYIDTENGFTVVEDVKGFRNAVYLLKKKMFLYGYQDIVFSEI